MIGKKAKKLGDNFEKLIDLSCNRYASKGVAYISKTYPPFTATGRNGNLITGFYGNKGQPDFSGTLADGRSIVFEAKHTNTTNIPFSRIAHHQKRALERHGKLGADAFILIAFRFEAFYKVPISEWIDLERNIGKKSVNEKDLAFYKLETNGGYIKFI